MDWNVDGHFIVADSPEVALREAARLYAFTPEGVRPWTAQDQADLDDLDA